MIGAKAPILIAHFEGAMDAGSAGTLAVVQLLRTLSPERVATFDTDQLIDYRSHRPVMVVEDWVTRDIVAPEIALDLVHDDSGMPLLVLHGPEPDARWEQFSRDVAQLAKDAGVEIVISLHGFPAAVPHTRPTMIHAQSTDPDLIPEQAKMEGSWRFPAPLSEFLQHRLADRGLNGLTLYAAIPYYMAESAFPRGGSALIRHLAGLTELSLPIGDLERGADEDAEQVSTLVGQNEEIQRTVAALERHYDAIARGEQSPFGSQVVFLESEPNGEGELPSAPESAEELVPEDFDGSMADAIGEAIEQYLRSQSSMGKRDSSSESRRQGEPRVNGDISSDRPGPRHRAPYPWEIEPESD